MKPQRNVSGRSNGNGGYFEAFRLRLRSAVRSVRRRREVDYRSKSPLLVILPI